MRQVLFAWLCAHFLGCVDSSQTGRDYQLVFQDIEAALMSVSGTAADDVWLVGARTRDGNGAMLLHYDGSKLTRVTNTIDADLWWVHARDKTHIYCVGSGGTVATGDGKRFTVLDTPGASTVYGVWADSNDEAWIVGGDPDVTPGFLWRYDGTQVMDVSDTLPLSPLPALFKVFGRSADDVWIVGMDGLVFHFNGSKWSLIEQGATERLFTVHAAGKNVVAVGGFGSGVIFEGNSNGFENVAADGTSQLYGVFMTGASTGYAVGVDGLVMRRDAQGWHEEDTGQSLFFPFHAVWVDPEGSLWAVGGDVETPALNRGMLLHRGPSLGSLPEL